MRLQKYAQSKIAYLWIAVAKQ